MVDVLDIGDLNCGSCGGCDLIATCSEHDEQDTGSLRGGRVYCCDYDYERGRECRKRLHVECRECGAENSIEGLE